MAASSAEKERMGIFAEDITRQVSDAGYSGAAFIFHEGSHSMAVRCEPHELHRLLSAASLAIADFMRKADMQPIGHIDNVQLTLLREDTDARS
jgi:hypothetical protein